MYNYFDGGLSSEQNVYFHKLLLQSCSDIVHPYSTLAKDRSKVLSFCLELSMQFSHSVSGNNSHHLLSLLHHPVSDHWLLLILQGEKLKPTKRHKYFRGTETSFLSSAFFTGISRHVQKFCKIQFTGCQQVRGVRTNFSSVKLSKHWRKKQW